MLSGTRFKRWNPICFKALFNACSTKMNTTLRQRSVSLRDRAVKKLDDRLHGRGWVIERQTTTFADDGAYSNIDSDVTPLERRTWTSWTILGFWCSDALNSQGWEAPSSIIAAGLTWREAVYLSMCLPLIFSPLSLHFCSSISTLGCLEYSLSSRH
jgi:hypothetical protein